MNIRRAVIVTSALVISLGLASCSAPSEKAASSLSPSETATSLATATPTPPPVFLPEGTATENLEYLGWVISTTVASDPAADSYAVASAVGASGFDPATVQFTFSTTAAGLPADTSEIAVQFAGECLIGQYGPAQPTVITKVMPLLASGGCLIGTDVQPLS
ncbi:hypothetical protein M2119_000980 [Aurantimicrobium minutum]|uniref:DUF6993 domain-containing protein n=1 Tax=Aurantimicrobium minutum TaxID=708131 RepID=UPI00247648E5|nr:hypothetical protein [Aurantimicrobium minutum]MDH6532743.1 hypothetical protein [Aurantimicrobium minutum]